MPPYRIYVVLTMQLITLGQVHQNCHQTSYEKDNVVYCRLNSVTPEDEEAYDVIRKEIIKIMCEMAQFSDQADASNCISMLRE
jgi:hypothetical protein